MLDFSVTFVITIFNIVLLAFILRAALFKPVSRFMAERAKRVRDSIDAANADRERAQELLDLYREKLKAAEIEAEGIMKAAREKARAQADGIVANGKIAAEALIADARRQIDSERQKALARFGVEAVAMVMAASSRLTRREFCGEDDRRYAGMLLDELSASPAAGAYPRQGKA